VVEVEEEVPEVLAVGAAEDPMVVVVHVTIVVKMVTSAVNAQLVAAVVPVVAEVPVIIAVKKVI